MEMGFLGLGIMGTAMARNLIEIGFKVNNVWNRTLSKCDEQVELGASIGVTPAAVVKKCKFTIAMLSDPMAVLSVAFDKDGVLEEICSGKGYIDMSTVDPKTSKKINAVSVWTADGTLCNFKSSQFALTLCCGSLRETNSKGLVLAERTGLNHHDLLDVLDLGAIANLMFKLKGPAMLKGNHSPSFPLKHQQKDMRLALALGDKSSLSMPVAAATNEAFKKAKSMGLGDLDFFSCL